ncbi:unnamed protein product, partial [marine sediment metagenome]
MREEDAVPAGSTCVKILTGKTPLQIRTAWDTYQAKIREEWEELERLKKVKEWRIANEGLITKLDELSEGKEHHLPIAYDFLDKIAEYGTLTPKQMEFAKSLIGKSENLIPYEEYRCLIEAWFYSELS